MRRDHRLRARRCALGVSQYELGCLAGFVPQSAQSSVSNAELNGLREIGFGGASYTAVRKVRSALVYLESEPRRQREWERRDRMAALMAEEALRAGYAPTVRHRLVTLLLDGRSDEYDVFAARCPGPWVDAACEEYLELSTPQIKEAR